MNSFKIVKTIKELDGWFNDCDKKVIYYIFIQERKNYSKINWDYFSIKSKYVNYIKFEEDFNNKKINDIIDIFLKHVNNIDKNKFYLTPNYQGNYFVGYFDNIPKEIAPKLANDLANYFNSLVVSYKIKD